MEWWRGVGGVAEWSVVAVVELWVVDGGGVVEWWSLEVKWNGGWWLVLVEWWYGGCRKSCLCVSFSGVLVLLSDLFVQGVQTVWQTATNLEVEWNGSWRLVVVEWWYGGCTKTCLCVSFSGVLVLLSDLSYRGGQSA